MPDLLEVSSSSAPVAGDLPATGARSRLAISDAPELLTNLGYLLVHGSPFENGPAYLLVAIRPRPTRAHFDPERVEYWTVGARHAERDTLEWPICVPADGYSWGTIKIIDRLAAVNQFVSFGGSLSVSRDGGLNAALFRSDAPILAVGGRGEAGDPLATSVVGFFARLRAACGSDGSFAEWAGRIDPMAVYAAYLSRALGLYRHHIAEQSLPSRIHALVHYEHCRLARDFAAATAAGDRLNRVLDATNTKPKE